jgi:hypothetical protein
MAKTQAKKKAVAKKPVKVVRAAKVVKKAKAAKPAQKAKPAKAAKPAKPAKASKGRGFRQVQPSRKLEMSSAAGSGDIQKMAREIDKRVQQYEREILKARKTLEKLSVAVLRSAHPAAGKPEKGPRRFRSGVVKIREEQREMTESSTQMRMLAGRRQELLWLKSLLTGEKPQTAAVARPAAPTPPPGPVAPPAPSVPTAPAVPPASTTPPTNPA